MKTGQSVVCFVGLKKMQLPNGWKTRILSKWIDATETFVNLIIFLIMLVILYYSLSIILIVLY